MFAGGRKEKFVNGPHPPDYFHEIIILFDIHDHDDSTSTMIGYYNPVLNPEQVDFPITLIIYFLPFQMQSRRPHSI